MRMTIFSAGAAIAFALAQTPDARAVEVRTERVSYGDLDIGSEVGARVLLHRIRAAARRVCDDHTGPLTLQACIRDTVHRSVAGAHLPVLTAVHENAGARRQHLQTYSEQGDRI